MVVKATKSEDENIVPPSLIDVALNLDTNGEAAVPSTMWESKVGLFQMIRPSSIPGICLLHMTGVYLALQHAGMPEVYWPVLLKEPLLWMTLLAINLVSASSMVINDYYDVKLGRDQQEEGASLLLGSTVSLSTARQFLMMLYALSLLIGTCLPGVWTRLAVVSSLMMTYLYTKYLKPRTWIKNISCATIIAFSPLASGMATLNLNWLLVTTNPSTLCVSSLGRLFGALFFALVAREIYMDCNDIDADAASGIKTVPVVYGKRFAVKVSALGNICMSCLVLAPHCLSLTTSSSSSIRRLVFASMAAFGQLRRSFQIQRNPNDRNLIRKAVDEGLLTVAFLLASFI